MKKLMKLYRLRRKFETPTLAGYKPLHKHALKMWNLINDFIELRQGIISAQTKTRLRKECVARGIKLHNE